MKHQTPDSMKFKKFARRLNLRRWEAIGVLEALWLTTQKNAPRGDIGRYDNESIAIEIDWPGDPDALIQALVECGWLDEHETHRLVVHDWHCHAPRYVHGVVSKVGGFVTVADYSPALQSVTVVGDCTEQQPNLTKPNLTKDNVRTLGVRSLKAEEYPTLEVSGEVWEKAKPLATLCRERLADGRPLRGRDRVTAIKAAVIATQYLGEQWLREILSQPQFAKNGSAANRFAYFCGCAKGQVEANGYDWHQLLRSVRIPAELEKPPPVAAECA